MLTGEAVDFESFTIDDGASTLASQSSSAPPQYAYSPPLYVHPDDNTVNVASSVSSSAANDFSGLISRHSDTPVASIAPTQDSSFATSSHNSSPEHSPLHGETMESLHFDSTSAQGAQEEIPEQTSATSLAPENVVIPEVLESQHKVHREELVPIILDSNTHPMITRSKVVNHKSKVYHAHIDETYVDVYATLQDSQ
ncbi:hypothetical protein V6N11_079607 [Hibiscus sabdariffa]|uniref:Uncharacterized protein n=1 Tax=Hibiscus sabdariffa TaxID=183260 RepID=A0ABR2RWE7_9ROSI